MKKIYRLSNLNHTSRLIVSDSLESVNDLALHFKMVKDLKNLKIREVTNEFLRYQEALEDVTARRFL